MVSNCIKVMLILGLFVGLTPVRSAALGAGGLVFSEIQTGSSSSASQEFIELYNAGPSPVVLTGWQVQYNSASNTNWDKPTRKFGLNGTLQPHGYYLLGSSGYAAVKSNMTFSSTLAGGGGHLRLVNGTVPEDLLGWGTASSPLVAAAEAPPGGQSLNRLLGPDGKPLSPTDNQTDYYVSNRPSPGEANSPVISQSAVSGSATGLEISELLPNPASPITDAAGEFVELYNSGTGAIPLAGYKLTSGSNDTYKYVLPDMTVNAGQYIVLYSAKTHLTLSNTAGRVRLYDPAGGLADETGIYDKAGDNQSWIFADNSWQWTAKPTPGAANILLIPSTAPTKKTKVLSTSKKSAKGTKPKTRVAATKSHNSSGPAQSGSDSSVNGPAGSDSHPYILAGAGVLALLYGCYEYRYDLANRLHNFRKNRAARRAVRPAA